MKKSNRQGFALFELLLAIVFVAVVALIGLRVVNSHKDTQASSTQNSGTSNIQKESSTAAVVPEINKTADLDKASAALDQNDNSTDDSHDSGALSGSIEDF